MSSFSSNLPVIWAILIAFGLMMYVVMDGFDLGVGILFPFVSDRSDRDLMAGSVTPVWDGNETWLVFGAASLLANFPLAYSVLLSALYIPLVMVLAGLICRGTAFEFRFKSDPRQRARWDKAFAWGSYTAAFFQGVALGAFISGFRVTGPSYEGGALDWLTPFNLLTGTGVVAAYALLGGTWLTMKTEGPLRRRVVMLTRPVAMIVLVQTACVSLWTPLTHPEIAARWFSLPDIFFFAPVPILMVVTAWFLFKTLSDEAADATPFLLALLMIFLGYSGLAISLWPNIVPPLVSIYSAAAPVESMRFTLYGAVVVIPLILGYTAWSYYVFRGKVQPGDGYH